MYVGKLFVERFRRGLMGCFGVWVCPFVMGYWVFVSEFVCKRVT